MLHHYHSAQLRGDDVIPDPMFRRAAAERTLFLVLPLYGGSLRSFIAARRAEVAALPHGLGWEWFGAMLLRMLRAEQHLIMHDLVHGATLGWPGWRRKSRIQ